MLFQVDRCFESTKFARRREGGRVRANQVLLNDPAHRNLDFALICSARLVAGAKIRERFHGGWSRAEGWRTGGRRRQLSLFLTF